MPEAQLDRFMMRIAVGYPGREEEREILSRRRARRGEEAHVDCVVSRDELLAMQAALEDVHVDRSMRNISSTSPARHGRSRGWRSAPRRAGRSLC